MTGTGSKKNPASFRKGKKNLRFVDAHEEFGMFLKELLALPAARKTRRPIANQAKDRSRAQSPVAGDALKHVARRWRVVVARATAGTLAFARKFLTIYIILPISSFVHHAYFDKDWADLNIAPWVAGLAVSVFMLLFLFVAPFAKYLGLPAFVWAPPG